MSDNKAALIREMLEDGLSPKEIKAELKADGVEVTSQYIYNVKRRWNEGKDDDEETAPKSKKGKKNAEMDEEDDSEGDYFTRLPKEKRRTVEMEEYECGACGETWKAPRNKYQAVCPNCGVDFE